MTRIKMTSSCFCSRYPQRFDELEFIRDVADGDDHDYDRFIHQGLHSRGR